jgi:hypothetical protein
MRHATMQSGTNIQTFWVTLLPTLQDGRCGDQKSCTLKMAAASFSTPAANFYQTLKGKGKAVSLQA